MSCKFAQREMKQETEKIRCVNKKCDSFLEIVDLEVCTGCPFSSVKKKTEGECYDCEGNVVGSDGVISESSSGVFTFEDMAKEGLTPETLPPGYVPKSTKEFPPMTTQVWNYQNALRKWQKAGRPVRSPEDIVDIHETHCKKCDWYDTEKKRCKGCGCRVTEGGMAVFNKIKMATEHCPKELW